MNGKAHFRGAFVLLAAALAVLAVAAAVSLRHLISGGNGDEGNGHAARGKATVQAAGGQDGAWAGRQAPRRIVSLAPSVTEMLFLIGAGDRLVGATDYCNYPPDAARIPRIGGYINPGIEAILAANPDLIVGSADGTPADLANRLRKLGKDVLIAAIEKVDDVPKAIREIGGAVGAEEAAGEKAAAIEAAIRDFERIPADWRRPRVLLCYSLEPIVAAGPGSFGDDLIR
ncbi:MAG: helical backbone metal receptor, partial [Planctomycetota bacterium]|nr:helical backbone metal receptor [Planctomycetota bacterium]